MKVTFDLMTGKMIDIDLYKGSKIGFSVYLSDIFKFSNLRRSFIFPAGYDFFRDQLKPISN